MSDPQDIQVDAGAQEIPGTLPVLPLRDTVVFPDTMIPLTIGQERSIKLIDDVLAGDRLLALVTSRDAEVEVPGPDLLYPVGTVGLAHKMIKLPDGTMRILVQGLQRVRVIDDHQLVRELVDHCPDCFGVVFGDRVQSWGDPDLVVLVCPASLIVDAE